ncbi:MAG: response regulator [Acidobacteria bacterium]|nr:response regulator [Acidobacteriota bacterium]
MKPKILVVLSPHRRSELLRILEGKNLQIYFASDFREAQEKLQGHSRYDLLLSDEQLPDGSWRDLLQFLLESKTPCEMIVCSRCGDEQLWAEVLQCGAYDLLVEPFERQEVDRIIQSAIENQYMRRFSHSLAAS